MHDSYTPLGGAVPLVLMQLGEVVFGGVGCGLYGMLAFAILTVFIAGLIIKRTPEFLGKKIEPFEMKWAVVVCLATPVAILIGGPDGLDPALKARADETIRLSSLTLPHPLVRVLLAEQLYRGWSILAGHPYHRE